MQTNKERPSKTDFIVSWKPFIQIIDLLKPSTCIFMGTSMEVWLRLGTKDLGLKKTESIWKERINGAYAKSGLIIDKNDRKTNLLFIKHPSQRFSVNLWRHNLYNSIPEQLDWLASKTSA